MSASDIARDAWIAAAREQDEAEAWLADLEGQVRQAAAGVQLARAQGGRRYAAWIAETEAAAA